MQLCGSGGHKNRIFKVWCALKLRLGGLSIPIGFDTQGTRGCTMEIRTMTFSSPGQLSPQSLNTSLLQMYDNYLSRHMPVYIGRGNTDYSICNWSRKRTAKLLASEWRSNHSSFQPYLFQNWTRFACWFSPFPTGGRKPSF